jgi:DNA-binding transcriptional regulator PaaX
MSPIKEKILLLLVSGIALGYSCTPQKQLRVLKGAKKWWQNINERVLREKIRELYRSKLVETKENPDGSLTLVLTDKGKMKALTYHFQEMKPKTEKWDGKWRIVIFDIPEKKRRARDALREKLKELGFYELQKSVFVFPYECMNEIEFIVEFFQLRKYVRYGVLDSIDNELHLKKIFELI